MAPFTKVRDTMALTRHKPLKGYDYGSFTYFNIVKYKLLNKIEKQ